MAKGEKLNEEAVFSNNLGYSTLKMNQDITKLHEMSQNNKQKNK